jgi:DNA-binding transcriptional MerR regulator
MRISQLARQVGISADTIRFYERQGLLPRIGRQDNGYRDYGAEDAEHLRLLVELRRLDIPLDEAASLARSCHTGHCDDAASDLPRVIAARRAAVASRIDGLRALDAQLAALAVHLTRRLPTIENGACCSAADAVLGGCACCAPAGPAVRPA